jgi:hypothetical protein
MPLQNEEGQTAHPLATQDIVYQEIAILISSPSIVLTILSLKIIEAPSALPDQ